MTARPHKYRAKPVVIDNIRFASTAEGNRYLELKTLFRANKITDLTLQPEYLCEVNGVKVCIYRADFQYFDYQTGKTVVEDKKGFRTAEYKLKKRLVEACHGITITEV